MSAKLADIELGIVIKLAMGATPAPVGYGIIRNSGRYACPNRRQTKT